jgi:hypothetical protein
MSRNSGKAKNRKWSELLSRELESVSGSNRMFRGGSLERAFCAQSTMARVLLIGVDPQLLLQATLEYAEHTVMVADEFDQGAEYFSPNVADVAPVVLKSRIRMLSMLLRRYELTPRASKQSS